MVLLQIFCIYILLSCLQMIICDVIDILITGKHRNNSNEFMNYNLYFENKAITEIDFCS